MTPIIEKVTTFITRPRTLSTDLLLFKHPNTGIQIPAGTVEIGESARTAALRESHEESGLKELSIKKYLGSRQENLPPGRHVIYRSTNLYSLPDETSFDWAYLRRGLKVNEERRASGWTQITYVEHDRQPDPQYISMQITGWVPEETLADACRRHFFQLVFHGQSMEYWSIYTDQHHFKFFWAPLSNLPEIIHPQDTWLEILFQALSK